VGFPPLGIPSHELVLIVHWYHLTSVSYTVVRTWYVMVIAITTSQATLAVAQKTFGYDFCKVNGDPSEVDVLVQRSKGDSGQSWIG